MNKHVKKRHLGDKAIRGQVVGGTYRPISKNKVRLPADFPRCSERQIAQRQIDSTFATVFADHAPEDALLSAKQALVRLEKPRDEEGRLDALATEFSRLRG